MEGERRVPYTCSLSVPAVLNCVLWCRVDMVAVMCTLNSGNEIAAANMELDVEAQLAWRCLHSHLRPDLTFQKFLDKYVALLVVWR